jgi:hypothetical protein
MMGRLSSCAGETQLQQAIAAVRTMWERVGHRAGTAGLETAWTSEFLRRIVHGTGQSYLYYVVCFARKVGRGHHKGWLPVRT